MSTGQGSSRGGGHGGSGGNNNAGNKDGQTRTPKKSCIDLSKLLDKQVRVKLQGGKEVTGTLKGYDGLLNIVLDDTQEFVKDPDDPFKVTEETRSLGLSVLRGTHVAVVSPIDGFEAIPNPFVSHE